MLTPRDARTISLSRLYCWRWLLDTGCTHAAPYPISHPCNHRARVKNATSRLMEPLTNSYRPPVTFIKNRENLIQTLADKIVNPREWVIGQCNPKRFHAGIYFVHTQIRIAKVGYIVLWRIEAVPVFLHVRPSAK